MGKTGKERQQAIREPKQPFKIKHQIEHSINDS